MVMDPETKAPRSFGFILCDREDFSIVRNWDVIGRQGTGSPRIVIENVTLPANRLMEVGDAKFQQFYPQPGRALFQNPLFHGPWLCLLLCELVSVAVGAARGALDIYESELREKKQPLPPFLSRSESPEFQRLFGHVQGLVHTAEAISLQLGSLFMEFSRRALEGSDASPEEQRRFARFGQQSVHLAWEAVDTMFHTSLTSAARKTSLLGRYFMNLAVIRTNGILQPHQTSINECTSVKRRRARSKLGAAL